MKNIYALALALAASVSVHAQSIAVNADGSDPDSSAIFDIKSTSKGILIPRMTQAQRDLIARPASSLLIYQTDNDSGFYYRRGAAWYPFADNLGTHKLSQNLNTDGFYISRAGDNVGIRPWSNGMVRFYGIQQTTSTAWETARVDENGGFVAFGSLGFGNIPATGNGSRMMWYPFKSSFRAGVVDGNTGAWDDANNGFFSAAFGYNTKASSNFSFAAGDRCAATGIASVAMGSSCAASESYTTAMGYQSEASGRYGFAAGYRDTAGGVGSVALGNLANAADDYSVVIGRGSSNTRTGSFVFADNSNTTDVLTASANNQFTTRFAGGYRLLTNAAATIGVQIAAGGNSWTTISDSTKKERFLTADGESFLQQLRRMRLGSWNYKTQREFRHYGPMAQDFYAAFGRDAYGIIGNDTTIASADMDGVMMIMIKALEQRTTEQASALAALKTENEQLKTRLAATSEAVEEWQAFKALMADNKETRALMERVSKMAETRRQNIAQNNNR